MMRVVLLFAVLIGAVSAEDLPRGQIIDDVKCTAEPSQSYALYLPSNYSPYRRWNVIFAFSPMAHGRRPVEQFREAAGKYGYIVAASNNSRNGSWETSRDAIRAMTADVDARFALDPKRMYTTGFSGGARVAMQVALASGKIAGVIACSAAFPNAQTQKSAGFPIFGTAGTEDFNYLEMRQLDRTMTTPHRVMIFEGSHEWLPTDLAREAIEWLEVQAMKSGWRTRDEAMLDKIFAARIAHASAMTNDLDTWRELKSLAADFDGLRDVTEFVARAAAMEKQKGVKDGLKKERFLEWREEQLNSELEGLEHGLENRSKRVESLSELRNRFSELSRHAKAKDDSAERRLARRVIRGTIVRSYEQVKDEDYRKLLDELR